MKNKTQGLKQNMNKLLIEMFLENKDVLNQASPSSIEKITPTSYLITYDTKSKFFKVYVLFKDHFKV